MSLSQPLVAIAVARNLPAMQCTEIPWEGAFLFASGIDIKKRYHQAMYLCDLILLEVTVRILCARDVTCKLNYRFLMMKLVYFEFVWSPFFVLFVIRVLSLFFVQTRLFYRSVAFLT